ncbi:phosphate acetyltransferase [Bacteroidota bacterium]
MDLLNKIRENAKTLGKKIVLPESFEERTLKAADFLLKEKICEIILIGDREKILARAKELKLDNIYSAIFVDPENNPKIEEYATLMVGLRKKQGLTMDEAYKLLKDPLYLATIIIKNGDADGEVAGASNATTDVLRPAFQYVKTMPGISVVSGAFLMFFKNKSFGDNGLLIFADCAVHPNPTENELAEIAVATARTAKTIAGIEPRVALLSFSTKGSAKHEMVDKVRNATEIAKKMAPEISIDGEFQADTAIVESIGKKKAPESEIAGKANVLIFPSLETGNITYKLVQRLADAEAVGPILQGMAAPINDLSRGCSVSDIINLVAITVNQAAGI